MERHFSRLKGRLLGLAPLSVQRDDHRVGLVRLLPLVEGVVRQRLSELQEELAGLVAGNPKRRTSQPTTERLLEAFREVTLTIVRAPGFTQHQVLTLFGFSLAIYGQRERGFFRSSGLFGAPDVYDIFLRRGDIFAIGRPDEGGALGSAGHPICFLSVCVCMDQLVRERIPDSNS